MLSKSRTPPAAAHRTEPITKNRSAGSTAHSGHRSCGIDPHIGRNFCPMSSNYNSVVMESLRAHARERQAFINNIYGARMKRMKKRRRQSRGAKLHLLTAPARLCPGSSSSRRPAIPLRTEPELKNPAATKIIQQGTQRARDAQDDGRCSLLSDSSLFTAPRLGGGGRQLKGDPARGTAVGEKCSYFVK